MASGGVNDKKLGISVEMGEDKEMIAVPGSVVTRECTIPTVTS